MVCLSFSCFQGIDQLKRSVKFLSGESHQGLVFLFSTHRLWFLCFLLLVCRPRASLTKSSQVPLHISQIDVLDTPTQIFAFLFFILPFWATTRSNKFLSIFVFLLSLVTFSNAQGTCRWCFHPRLEPLL